MDDANKQFGLLHSYVYHPYLGLLLIENNRTITWYRRRNHRSSLFINYQLIAIHPGPEGDSDVSSKH